MIAAPDPPTFCTLLAILSASSALALASRASAAAFPSDASACRVFSSAAMMVALMEGIFFMASSAAVLLSLTLRSKSGDSSEFIIKQSLTCST